MLPRVKSSVVPAAKLAKIAPWARPLSWICAIFTTASDCRYSACSPALMPFGSISWAVSDHRPRS